MVVKKGDKVKVEYEGKLEDGTVFDSSTHGDHSHPIEFEVGCGKVIPGFEKGVEGMELNEEKELTIEPNEAYGTSNKDLIREVPRSQIPIKEELKEGMVLMAQTPDGQQSPIKIVEVNGDKVKIDLNHPLAGKKLIFKIKVVDIESK